MDLITRKDLLERLVYLCFNSDHPGVRAESPRLLAWLIKHCHSNDPFPALIRVTDSIKCLIEMLPSSHAVMQNESLLALNLLCIAHNQSTKVEDKNILEACFVSSDIGKYIAFLINKYSEKMEREIIENLLFLLEKLCTYASVKNNLKNNQVAEVLKKYLDRADVKELHNRVNKLISSIDSG